MSALDRRLNAYRPDLAAESLKGLVEAPHFVKGTPAQIAVGLADLKQRPDAAARIDSQLLAGEKVTVYEEKDGWAWVQSADDNYVGYVETAALRQQVLDPTHCVGVLRTFVFPQPDLKDPPIDVLSMGAQVCITAREGNYLSRADGGWVYAPHLAAPDQTERDFVATALTFMGVPYLWGGRSSLGLDCSALVQLSLGRAGLPCPRDSDMQLEALGEEVPWDPAATLLQRGDLIYYPGHVVIALDQTTCVHANAKDMMVAIEDLAPVEERVKEESGGRGVIGVRRLSL